MKLEPLIYVSDLEQSIKFYVEALGFKVGKLYPSEKEPTYAPILIDGYKLMLVLARTDNTKFRPKGLGGSGLQLFIQVDNVDEVYRKIKQKAVIVDDIKSRSWGDREFTIKDPDGYLISFYTTT